MSRERCKQGVLDYFGEHNIECAVVALELHQDGFPHLHCAIVLHEEMDTRTASALDVITGQHGNYQSMKNASRVFTYCTKSDDAHLGWGPYKLYIKSKLVSDAIVELIKEDKGDVKRAREKNPGFFMMNKQRVDEEVKRVKLELGIEHLKRKTLNYVLRGWQTEAYQSLLGQNDREVLWVWEPRGEMGKTEFGLFLAANHDAYLWTGGKSSDFSQAYGKSLAGWVVCNLPKGSEDFVQYQVFEMLKDGFMFSPKYDSQNLYFVPPKVLVLANFPPKRELCLQGRYKVMRIGEPDGRLIRYGQAPVSFSVDDLE